MPVVAHSEKGLAIDLFGEHSMKFDCDYYSLQANKICWVKKNQVKYYDLKERNMILELEIEEPREVKMAPNGENVGILTNKYEMIIFDKAGIRFKKKEVFKFEISNCLLAYVSQISFYIHKTGSNGIMEKPFHNSKISMLEFFIFESSIFLATKKLAKDSQHKILKIEEDSVEVLQSLETLQGFSMKAHASGKYMLFLLMTSYVNNSYFPESDLYFYDVEKNDFRKLSCSTVHYCTFISSGFAVCHGPQPSDVSVYDFNCDVSFRFPKGTRNRIFFNQHENVVVFSGFDNLSGDMEVFDVCERKLIARFNVLGASLVHWKETGSYFYVSTTSYFQEDNKITVYDYYGRVVDEKSFRSLASVATYGEKEEFIKLEQPGNLIIDSRKKYVPPSLRGFTNEAILGKKKMNDGKQSPMKAKTKSKEEIISTLQEIQSLKEKMKMGGELSVKELNFILKEPKLNSDLRKFEK